MTWIRRLWPAAASALAVAAVVDHWAAPALASGAPAPLPEAPAVTSVVPAPLLDDRALALVERRSLRFVQRRMLDGQRAPHTLVALEAGALDDAGPHARAVLSESVGLAMTYAALARSPALFDAQLRIGERILQGPRGLLAWRASDDLLRTWPSSASIDDLTVVRALLHGAAAWHRPGLERKAQRIAGAVLEHQVVGDLLVDAASWNDDGVYTSDTVQLAYLDLRTMALLAERDAAWEDVYEGSLALLREAEREGGLFPETWSVVDGTFGVGDRDGDGDGDGDGNRADVPDHGDRDALERGDAGGDVVNDILVAYCALHLAEVGEGGRPTLDHMLGQLERTGFLAGRHELDGGAALEGYEGIAVYAIGVRLALALGDLPAAEQVAAAMAARQRSGTAAVDGAFSLGDTAHTFDNLHALIALRALRLARAGRWAILTP